MKTNGTILTKLEDFTGGGPVLCPAISPDRIYKDGKPTDQVCGTRYEVVFPTKGFTKTVIKTPELKAALTQDDLICNNGAVSIEPVNFTAVVYRDSRTGQPAFSLKADTVRVVDEKNLPF